MAFTSMLTTRTLNRQRNLPGYGARILPPHMNLSISDRPRRGNRYHARTFTQRDSIFQVWNNVPPGGKKLWCRLVIAFTSVCFFGVGLVVLGAVFIGQAHQMHSDGGTALPLTWCIIGIVSGSLLVVGSILLGRVMVSPKWRKDEQPSYPSAAPRMPHAVHYVSEGGVAGDGQIDLPTSPPPYSAIDFEEDGIRTPVFILPGRNVALTLPSAQPVHNLPGYSEVAGPLPDYEEVTKTIPDQVSSGTSKAPGTCSGRIKVLTVVTRSRGDPPPYEGTTHFNNSDSSNDTNQTVMANQEQTPLPEGGVLESSSR